MVVAVLAALMIIIIVVVFVSRVVMDLVVLVDKPRPDHLQVAQAEFIELPVSGCSQNYDSGILTTYTVTPKTSTLYFLNNSVKN